MNCGLKPHLYSGMWLLLGGRLTFMDNVFPLSASLSNLDPYLALNKGLIVTHKGTVIAY
jgi:hypothetical protein